MTASQKFARTQPSNRTFIMVLVGIFILGAGLIALAASNKKAATGIEAQTSDVAIVGESLPDMPENSNGITNSENDSAIGMVAPTLTGTGFDDEPVSVEPDGRPKAVYFLAHWCQFCQQEAPLIQSLIDGGSQPEGMDIYTVSTSVSSGLTNYSPEAWLDGIGYTSPTMRDSIDSEALSAYGAGAFPYAVYLDGDNRVIGRSAGATNEEVMTSVWQTIASTPVFIEATTDTTTDE